MAGLDGNNFSREYEDISMEMFREGTSRRIPPNYLPVQPNYSSAQTGYMTQNSPFLPKLANPSDDQNADNAEDEEYRAAVRRYVEIAVSLATIVTENLLSHPLVVLRRQCQVQPGTRRWHMTPFTLIPVVYRLHQRQGVVTLWKGLGSCLLVRGLVLAAEDSLSKFTPWPKDIDLHAITSMKVFGQHLLLKSVSLALVTPFYSASLVETVQSDIASEKPGLFDVFKEGLCRCVSVGAARGRMLPVWSLVPITVTHGLMRYLVALAVRSAATWTIQMQVRAQQVRRGALNRDWDSEENQQRIEVTASFIGMVAAEVICYPLETILHRLHLQGTRTIVDQLDNGTEVIPILTAYSGILDCYTDAVAKEGFGGLYRGFGALVAQVAVHWAVIRMTRFLVCWGASVLRPPPPPRRPPEVSTTATAARGRLQVDAAQGQAGDFIPLKPTQLFTQSGNTYGSQWQEPQGAIYRSSRVTTPGGDWKPDVTSTPVSTPIDPFPDYKRRGSK